MSTPDPQIQQQLADIAAMQTAMNKESCNTHQPFITIQPDNLGTPPQINFNIPQGTAFTTYGYLLKNIAYSSFKDFTKNIPSNNYFDFMEGLSIEQATQLLHPNVVANPAPQFFGFSVPGATYNTLAEAQAAGYMGGNLSNVAHQPKTLSAPNQIFLSNPSAPQSLSSPMVNLAKQGFRPLVSYRIFNQAPITKYVARPPWPVPRITVVEEYTTESFLGDYGAGRVVKTFSLLPGERTTMTVRTYKDMSSTSSKSDNMLDSFSDSSATELDTLMQKEQGDMSSSSDTSGGGGSSYATQTDSKNSSSSFSVSAGLSIPCLSIGGGYGQSESDVSTSGSGFNNSYDYNHTAARQSNVNTLNNAMNKHVQQSNANRQVDVNTTTTNTASSGEEDTTVRELINYNKSRVLNFTFRQLLQQYITVTYLSGLKFAYTNGYPESEKMVDLANLPNMLLDIIIPDEVTKVLCQLLQPYCSVLAYDDSVKQFLAAKTITYSDCLGLGCDVMPDEVIYRVNPACTMRYTDGPVDVTYNGVILSVKKQTLQTDSLIADALLGRGEALDCFNMKAQDAESMSAYIANLSAMQDLEDSIQGTTDDHAMALLQQSLTSKQIDKADKENTVIDHQISIITDAAVTPADRVTNFKKVFGDCCDVPQSCCGGCGCDGDEPATP